MHQCMHASHYCHVRLTIFFLIYTLRLSSFIIPPPSLSPFPQTPGSSAQIRIPIGQGIAGFVAQSGKSINIRDAYKSQYFYKEVDKTTGFVTRYIITINCIVQKIKEKFFLPNFKPQFKCLFHLYFK